MEEGALRRAGIHWPDVGLIRHAIQYCPYEGPEEPEQSDQGSDGRVVAEQPSDEASQYRALLGGE